MLSTVSAMKNKKTKPKNENLPEKMLANFIV